MTTTTLDGFELAPIGFEENVGTEAQWPGLPPYRRGATAGDGTGWDLRSVHDTASPETARDQILDDLRGGATSIELRLETGEARAGLQLAELEDLDRALAGVDLAIAPIALDAGNAFREAAAALIALWRRRGLDPSDCRGAFNADPLGEAARRGVLDPAGLDRLAELVGATADRFPGVTCARADALPYHDAGASDAQELACVIATGLTYLRVLVDAGIPLATALRQVTLRCSLDGDFLTGLAKVRALRELWSRIAGASLDHAGDTTAVPPPRIEAVAGRRALSRVDPWTNLLRVGSAMLGAALGGARTLVSLPDPDALGIPSRPLARRLARNLQLVLAEESHLHRVVDPAGGSWSLEALTDLLADSAWEQFQQIEADGGMLASLRAGRIQTEIAERASLRAERAAHRRDVLVGVNDFCSPEDEIAPAPSERPAPSRQPAADRNRELAFEDLVGGLAQGSALALGGRAAAIDVTPLPPAPTAEPFERLRRESRALLTNSSATIVLAKLGEPADWSPRVAFSRALLAVGGLDAIETEPCKHPDRLGGVVSEAIAGTAAETSAGAPDAAVLCSSDARYAEQGAAAVAALRSTGARRVLLAGRPSDLVPTLREAGVDQFLFAGADALEELRDLVHALTTSGRAAGESTA